MPTPEQIRETYGVTIPLEEPRPCIKGNLVPYPCSAGAPGVLRAAAGTGYVLVSGLRLDDGHHSSCYVTLELREEGTWSSTDDNRRDVGVDGWQQYRTADNLVPLVSAVSEFLGRRPSLGLLVNEPSLREPLAHLVA